MDNVFLPLQLAPTALRQSILPNWGFSLFSINLGKSSDPGKEYEVLENVGSYGKQLGHLAEALEVVIKQLRLLEAKNLSRKELDTLQVFLGDVAAVRSIKNRELSPAGTARSNTTT